MITKFFTFSFGDNTILINLQYSNSVYQSRTLDLDSNNLTHFSHLFPLPLHSRNRSGHAAAILVVAI